MPYFIFLKYIKSKFMRNYSLPFLNILIPEVDKVPLILPLDFYNISSR